MTAWSGNGVCDLYPQEFRVLSLVHAGAGDRRVRIKMVVKIVFEVQDSVGRRNSRGEEGRGVDEAKVGKATFSEEKQQ
jgi:hypothetical protein